MSILEELNILLKSLGIPFETGVFSDAVPDKYIVLIPLIDTFELHADNAPCCEIQEVRLALYSQGNYTAVKNEIVRSLLKADFTITDRKYIGFEPDTKYHHYNIDVLKNYETEEIYNGNNRT